MKNFKEKQYHFSLFNLGFRPFFLGSAIYSIIFMVLWLYVLTNGQTFTPLKITVYQWHAHEMIYGYVMAVIAGFLLTAVKNWTGIQTIYGAQLGLLFFSWFLARIMFLVGGKLMALAFTFDLIFVSFLIYSIIKPVVESRNWKQLGIVSKLVLLGFANTAFYLGYYDYWNLGVYIGIYGGFYLIIGLILTVGGRVIPFFIEGGVGYSFKPVNSTWITISGMVFFLVFFVSELFVHNVYVTSIASIALFIVYSIRLAGWYTKGIWGKPLIWSLYLAYSFIVLGFLLYAIGPFAGVSKFLSLHLFAYGGVGLITMSMMARVSIGHTGRDIHNPPWQLGYIFGLTILGIVFRVFLPMIYANEYRSFMVISQVLWIIAFGLFVAVFIKILVSQRIDGKFA